MYRLHTRYSPCLRLGVMESLQPISRTRRILWLRAAPETSNGFLEVVHRWRSHDSPIWGRHVLYSKLAGKKKQIYRHSKGSATNLQFQLCFMFYVTIVIFAMTCIPSSSSSLYILNQGLIVTWYIGLPGSLVPNIYGTGRWGYFLLINLPLRKEIGFHMLSHHPWSTTSPQTIHNCFKGDLLQIVPCKVGESPKSRVNGPSSPFTRPFIEVISQFTTVRGQRCGNHHHFSPAFGNIYVWFSIPSILNNQTNPSRFSYMEHCLW